MLQNLSKKKLNRNLKDPTCYIFEKLGVLWCQMWHSHVSIPFNSAPAHSTRPHNAKKSSLRYHFSPNSWKLGSQKLLPHGHFWWGSKFFSFSLPSGPRGMFEPIVTNSDTSNTHKHPKTPTNTHKTPTKSGATTLSWKSGWKPLTRREFWHLRIIFIIFRFRVTAV